MWLYLGTAAASIVLVAGLLRKQIPSLENTKTSLRHLKSVTTEVYNVIQQNGLGICLLWTKQVIANQISKRLVEIHHKYYIIHYPYGVTWYKIVIPRKRGPSIFDTITDQDGNDVKKQVFEFMGPSRNFHGMDITPMAMGYGKLTITFLDGRVEEFQANDKIIV